MNEIIEKMNYLSLNARISYSIMCLENYVLSKYKSIDFTVLLKDLWKINSVKLIDTEWYYPMMARSVSAVLEFENYEDSNYEEDENITKDQYNEYLELYTKIKADKNICTIIDTIINLPVYYLYTSVDHQGIEVTNDILKIIDILIKEKIDLPEMSVLEHSKLSIADYTDDLDSSKLTRYNYKNI